LHPRRFSRPLP